MKLALNLSQQSIGGPFGAVIVKDEKVIGKGSNAVIINNDPTAHAEMIAIRNACKDSNTHTLKGCTLYTSCEPCAMCMAACYWSGITTIHYCNDRLDAEEIGFSDAYIYKELDKDLNNRLIKMVKHNNLEAKGIFNNWKGKVY